MDDLIVIVLTLIIAVVGILGQIKKKKQEGLNSGPENPSDDIWDLFQNQPEEKLSKSEKEYIEEEVELPLESSYIQKYDFKLQKEGVSSKTESEISQIAERKVPAHNKERFSLKKAVIYSEILNRKYT